MTNSKIDAALNTPAALGAADMIRAAQHRLDKNTAPEVLKAWAILLSARDAIAISLASREMCEDS